jgi:hypothetical protein
MKKTQRPLDLEELARITAIADRDASKKKFHWPPKHYYLAIEDAVKAGDKVVVLDDRLFDIRYESSEKFWIQLRDDYVPCGWFTLEEVQKEVELLGSDTFGG